MAQLPKTVSRGVYYLPWFGSDGEIFLVAVSRSGRRILEATVQPNQNAAVAVTMLRKLLDEVDPVPLRLLT